MGGIGFWSATRAEDGAGFSDLIEVRLSFSFYGATFLQIPIALLVVLDLTSVKTAFSSSLYLYAKLLVALDLTILQSGISPGLYDHTTFLVFLNLAFFQGALAFFLDNHAMAFSLVDLAVS